MPAGGLLTAGIVGGLASGAGSAVAGGKGADASQKIAQAQAGAAETNRQQALGYAQPTAQELGSMNQQLQLAGQGLAQRQQALDRQTKVLQATDPAILESGKQALALLQGKSAPTLAPMLAQRQVQRTQLQQQLEQQLGPGGASSSAGAQALENFDLQTSNYTAGLQQQALGTLLGTTEAGQSSAMASGGQALAFGQQAQGLFGDVAGTAGRINQRLTSTALGTPLTPYAGSEHAGQLAGASSAGSAFGSLGNLSGQALGYGLSKSTGRGGFGVPTPGSIDPSGIPIPQSSNTLGSFGSAGSFA